MKKKIYKALSVLLTLMIVFSAFLCVFNTVSAATEKTYYLSSTGNDSNTGAVPHNSLKTVGKAIELANAAGLGAGDTVTVRVQNTIAVAWLAEGSFLPEYTFKLIVTSHAATGDAIIGTGATVNMGGDVLFTNIKVNFGSSYTNFCANGYNLEFGTGAVFAGSALMSGFSVGAYSGSKRSVYNITADKIPQTGIYYVKDKGTGDGSSAESPLGDVAAALNKAVTDGYIIGDTVKVMLIGDKVDMGTMPNYAYNLEFDSNDPAARTQLITSGAVANNASGLTTYNKVEVVREGDWKAQTMQGSNVVFSKDSKFSGGYGTSLVFGTNNGGGSAETIPGQKLVYAASGAPYSIYMSNWSWAKRTYTDVVSLDYDVPGGSSAIYLNAAYSGAVNGSTYYNKAVNINVINGKAITFEVLDNTTFEEGLQIINSAADLLSNTEGELTKVPADKLYLINNISGNNKIIEFTDTVGKYKVNLDNPEHVLVAKNTATGVETTYDGTSGFITLAAGAYELRIDRDPIYMDYYVDPEKGVEVVAGTRPEGVGSKDKPVKTYADATRLIAQDGLTEIDVATIYVPSGQTSEWGTSPATFTCQLIITSTMEGDPGTLQNYGGISLTGNTTLRNVTLNQTYQWAGLKLADYNFTVEEDATANVFYTYIWNTGYGVKHTKDQTITIKGNFITNSIQLGAEYHSHTSTGDINVYYDSAESAAALLFGGGTDASQNNIYEGNINITIKNATAFSLGTRKTGADIKGSLQVLVDDSVKLPYSVKTNFENFEVEGGKWYITNAATDDEFVDFTADKGKFATKNGAVAYSRQFGKDQVKHTGGIIDLSAASGSYTVSNKAIAPLTDDSHKMLYFRLAGGAHNISTRAKVTPGETYRFEYSIFTSLYEDCKPAIRDDGDRGVTCDVTVISEEKIGDYYRIVAEGTIPEDYRHGSTACFGVNLSAYSEGVIFDRTVYNVNDPDKTDCYEGNQNFHDGLDYVTLDQAKFWGKILKGAGMVTWTNGFEQLEIMNFSEDYISYLIALNNPNDGEWWNEDDIIEEEEFATYAKAKGTFTDQNGNGISGVKFVLESDEKSYTATTNAKGEFDFGTILTGFYDLYFVNGTEKIATGFSSFIAQDDVVVFSIVSDTSGIIVDSNSGQGQGEGQDNGNTNAPIVDDGIVDNNIATNDPIIQQPSYENNYESFYPTYQDTVIEEVVDPYVPSGSLMGTVYTPTLETVANLKIVLRGVGEVITDENGKFGFADIPVGNYELYAVNSDGSEYVFKTYTINEGVNLDVKLKYAPASNNNAEETDNGWLIWVIVASVVALLVVAGLVFFLIFKKKKIEQI